jgi:uncharacterized membrane protein
MGLPFQWDAELYIERPIELISWRSLPGSEVDTTGSVHFLPAPTGWATEVRVALKYDPPAGKTGNAIGDLLGPSPADNIREDLLRFKALMETGRIPSGEGQPPDRGGM